jgi:hypothetical protein
LFPGALSVVGGCVEESLKCPLGFNTKTWVVAKFAEGVEKGVVGLKDLVDHSMAF